MRKTGLLLLLLCQAIYGFQVKATDLDLSPAKWIWYPSERTLQNTFILFRREISIDKEKFRWLDFCLAHGILILPEIPYLEKKL